MKKYRSKMVKKSDLAETPDSLDKIPFKNTDYPPYIDPATGKFRKGMTGNPGGCPKGIIYKSTRLKNALMDFFEDNYLNSGKFMRWVRATRNEKVFFDYLLKHVIAKDINMNVEGESNLAQAIKEARTRQEKKTDAK